MVLVDMQVEHTSSCCGCRSATDVRTAVVKAGGKMADSGSVLFNFKRAAQVLVRADGASEEQVGRLPWFVIARYPFQAPTGMQPDKHAHNSTSSVPTAVSLGVSAYLTRRAAARLAAGNNQVARPAGNGEKGCCLRQVIDAAMEAGAEDVQPAEGEEGHVEGFRVSPLCTFFLQKVSKTPIQL